MADLALMISMGFTEELSKESLKKGNGNLEQALNWIEKVPTNLNLGPIQRKLCREG